jgi:hypothetical protein
VDGARRLRQRSHVRQFEVILDHDLESYAWASDINQVIVPGAFGVSKMIPVF